MDNRIHRHRRDLRDLLPIDDRPGFHRYLIGHAIARYRSLLPAEAESLGSVLAVGASWREARLLREFPFDEILLTGLLEPDAELHQLLATDPRLRYERQNLECVSLPSRCFDLVFCKETLHHLARPALGLYETLRICRRAVLLIEPWDSLPGRLFAALGLASVYEFEQQGNLGRRENHVYRWSRRQLVSLLNSYYLESGYGLELTLGWLSARVNAGRRPVVRRGAALAGWLLSLLPGARGNYGTALITPGSDLPLDPAELPSFAATSSWETPKAHSPGVASRRAASA